MPAIGIGIGIPFRRNIVTAPAVPTGLSASFTVDTISGNLTWTDNSGGKAQYEVYSSTNSEAYILLTTTVAGVTSYSDTTCKQNASVVYRIRAKYYSLYSDYVTATTLFTPICWKTNMSSLIKNYISSLNIAIGYTVNLDWGDGTNNNYTGANTNITHDYSTNGVYNISLTGDLNNILQLSAHDMPFYIGDISNWILPNSLTYIYGYTNNFTGNCPNLYSDSVLTIYRLYSNNISGTNITSFSRSLTVFDIKDQKVLFPTSEVDKLFKAAADWYQLNPPTANCTFNLSGANMGIPTDGTANVDIVRLIGYYSAAGFAATIICRTS